MTRGRKGRSPSTSNKGRPGGRCSGFCPVGRSLTPGKGGDFAPVAAHGHGAPPASARAGSIVEKQAASRIGAQAEPRTRALGNHFGRGTGHGGEQPLKATLPGDEFDLDRKSTRLNSSHVAISYAVFCLKK